MTTAVTAMALSAIGAGLGGGCTTTPAERPPEVTERALNESLVDSAKNAESQLDYATAADHYRRLYERDPDNIDALANMARNLRYAGNPREAIKALRLGIEAHGEETPLMLELAKSQFSASMTNDSAETLQGLREREPGNWEVLALLALIEDRRQMYDKAQALYAEAMKLAPEEPMLVNNYSLSLAQSGDLDRAIGLLEPLAYGENSTLQARQNLVMLYVINGEDDKAEQLAREDLPPDKALDNLSAFQTLVQ